jgi:hypothetical protein
MGADKLFQLINWTEEREQAELIAEKAVSLRQTQECQLLPFRCTPVLLLWQRQYTPTAMKTLLRFKGLLLTGRTRSGKTRRAISIFGHSRSLVVNCQGLGHSLPSLRHFNPKFHDCIIFDEANSSQVLHNKLVFQAGVDPVCLGQSACNAHAYQLHLHAVPMILCSNDFQLRSRPGQYMSPEDEEYLAENLIDGSLPDGESWFARQECESDDSSDLEES